MSINAFGVGVRAWLLAIASACLLGMQGCGGADGGPPTASQVRKEAVATDSALTGTYWNPFEPGSGMFFEAQGETGVVTLYLFEEGGRSVWFSGAGTLRQTAAGHEFQAVLQRYAGGQAAGSPTPRAPTSVEAGPAAIQFAAGGLARVQVGGRQFTVSKLSQSAAQLPVWPEAQRSAVQLETGIYWNPAQSGRGYTIEMVNGYANVGVFHYDAAGNAVWNLVTVGLPAVGHAEGDFASYRGGQTLEGAYRVPSREPDAGSFLVLPLTECSARLAFPGMPAFDVVRFGFNGPGCRVPPPSGPVFGGPTPTTPPPPASTGGVTFVPYAATSIPYRAPLNLRPNVSGLDGRGTFYRLPSGRLPRGLALNPVTGDITGRPDEFGTFPMRVELQVANVIQPLVVDLTIQVYAWKLVLVGGSGPEEITVHAGKPVPEGLRVEMFDPVTQQRVTDPGPDGYSSSPVSGLTVDRITGRISGTPVEGGTFTLSVSGRHAAHAKLRVVVVPDPYQPPAGSKYLDGFELHFLGAGLSGEYAVGDVVPSQFSFAWSGNPDRLSAYTLRVVVEDFGGLYQLVVPKVRISEGGEVITVEMTPKPLATRGRFQGMVRLLACLDDRCSLLVRPSPVVVPYDIVVR